MVIPALTTLCVLFFGLMLIFAWEARQYRKLCDESIANIETWVVRCRDWRQRYFALELSSPRSTRSPTARRRRYHRRDRWSLDHDRCFVCGSRTISNVTNPTVAAECPGRQRLGCGCAAVPPGSTGTLQGWWPLARALASVCETRSTTTGGGAQAKGACGYGGY